MKLKDTINKLTEAEIKQHLEEIYELLAGENASKCFTPEEFINYIVILNQQISEWENETQESFTHEVKK
jgi:hypothetical protein